MILIEDKTKVNRIYVPKHLFTNSLVFTLKFHSQSTFKEYSMEVIDEIPQVFYFVFSVDCGEFDDGEYKLEVYDGECCCSTNLLRIGQQEEQTYISNEYNNEIKYYE